MSGGRWPATGIPWPGGGGIAYLGYAVVTDADGAISQAVTVPAGTTYAVIFYGGWSGTTARTVSSMSLGGASATNLYTRASSDDFQDSYVYGVTTSAGSKTFAATFSGAFPEGGVAIIVFLSGVDSGNPIVATDFAETNVAVLSGATWASMSSVAGGIGLVFATGYVGDAIINIAVQSQTQIVNSTYNNNNYSFGHKTTSGSTETFGISISGTQRYWAAVAITLRPA